MVFARFLPTGWERPNAGRFDLALALLFLARFSNAGWKKDLCLLITKNYCNTILLSVSLLLSFKGFVFINSKGLLYYNNAVCFFASFF